MSAWLARCMDKVAQLEWLRYRLHSPLAERHLPALGCRPGWQAACGACARHVGGLESSAASPAAGQVAQLRTSTIIWPDLQKQKAVHVYL